MTERRIEERKEPTAKLSQARRRLWQALSDFIHAQGGWVTSPPFGRFLRIEVEQGSSLPVKLKECGHAVFQVGTTMRVTADRIPIVQVDVFELRHFIAATTCA